MRSPEALWAASVLGVLAAGCVHTPPRPDALRIDALTVEGERAIGEGEIKARILTTESSWIPSWVPFLGRVEWFDPSAWQADLRRITRFYESRGYYQARILGDRVEPTEPGHVRLKVTLLEGQPARIRSVSITGLEGLPAAQVEEVTADLPLKESDIFLEEVWATTKSLLQNRLRELGYAEVVLDAHATVDLERATVDTSIAVTTGQRYRFGKIFVATDSGAQVPAKLVADVARISVPEGEWYSDRALDQAQARVFQLGVFSGAKVNRGAPDREDGTIPVVVDVREAPFRTVRLGGGLSGDLIRQEVRLIGEYTNRNLGFARWFIRDARLDALSIRARVGWAFLPNVIAVATNAAGAKNGPTARILTEYSVPRLFGVPTLTFQSSLDLQRMLDVSFDYLGGELRLGVVWRPRVDVTVFPALYFSTYLLNSQLSLRDNAPLAALGCPEGTPCVLSALDLLVEYDRRDDKLEPRTGFYLALATQAGLSIAGQQLPYLRLSPEARGYVSFDRDKRWTLAGKLRLGTLISPDDELTPIVARFFSGGAYMRGFNQRRLAPHQAVPRVVGYTATGEPQLDYADGETLPVGGNGVAEASLELRWNVWGGLVLAIFTDWGFVTRAPLGAGLDLARSLYGAVGLGVRYLTPLGPIRLDLGFRLPFVGGPLDVRNDPGAGSQVAYRSSPGCFFGLGAAQPDPGVAPAGYGGSPENLCTVHLSIGEAF